MNCCDEYGQCRQGDDCPARTGKVLPHQAAHAAKVAEAATVAPIKTTRPHWMDGGSLPSAEAGNFYLYSPDTRPVGWLGTGLLLCWLMYIVGMVWLLMLGARWAYSQWSDVMWALLARLS